MSWAAGKSRRRNAWARCFGIPREERATTASAGQHGRRQDRSEAAPEAACVMPVPDDAPTPPAAHSRHGRPAGRWAYTDTAGRLCFFHDRYEHQGRAQAVQPLDPVATAGRPASMAVQGTCPAPRPLLGLPDLATKAGAVVIVEGEKARDAALRLLPEHPVICWQGGAQAVSKADWSPLAGRDCWVWPGQRHRRQQGRCPMWLPALGQAGARPASSASTWPHSHGKPPRKAARRPWWGADPLGDGDDAADLAARGWIAGHMALVLADSSALVRSCSTGRTAGKARENRTSLQRRAASSWTSAACGCTNPTARRAGCVAGWMWPAMVRDPKKCRLGLAV